MSNNIEVKHRKVISVGQLAILKVLYKYRFGSIALVQVSLGLKDGTSLYRKLKILVEQGYVGKQYKNDYKLKGIPAAYYLQTKGFRELQKLPEYLLIDEKLIKYSQKDKTVSRPFIDHNLLTYESALKLQQLYPNLRLFTKRELLGRQHFPKQLPDCFVSLKLEDNEKPSRFFLNIISDNTQRFQVEDIVRNYYEFFDNYNWEDKTKSKLPAMLLVCEAGKYEKNLQRYVAKTQAALGYDELDYFTTTLTALRGAESKVTKIWSSVEDPEELLALSSIS